MNNKVTGIGSPDLYVYDVTFENIPGAEDKDKSVWINGKHLGTVYRGWLRNGGDQWVYNGPLGPQFGEKTLKLISREIRRLYEKALT